MNAKSDHELLRAYAARRDEAAFRELVQRHTDLVYSAARRQVDSDAAARDLTQGVFTDLAHRAPDILLKQTGQSLAGWLHRATRFAALNHLRDARRRRDNERLAMEQLLINSDTPADWEQIRPALDEALDSLEDTDRDAVLLRYFKNHDLRTVGATLGISDDAAQKRVSRAVERLREFFAKRGVTVGASGLAVVISANAVQAAPVGLVLTISTAAALTGTTLATTATVTATKAIAMTALQKTIITAVLAVLAGAGIYEARQAAQLRDQVQTLQQQQGQLVEQNQELQSERDKATNRLADLLAVDSRLKANPNQNELLRLRGEVTRIQTEANDSTMKEARIAAGKAKQLKQYLEQNPNRSIPELQFVSEKDWANAVWNADLKTDDDARDALSKVRETAQNIFLNEMMKASFKKYLAANGNILPSTLSDLIPYFEVPVTDAMLNRYELLQSGTPKDSEDLVRLSVYADEDYDSNHGMSIRGAWGSRFNRVSGIVKNAIDAFDKANNGQKPSEVSQITPYLEKPMDAATVHKYFKQIEAGIIPNSAP